jgi:hypothetical protein
MLQLLKRHPFPVTAYFRHSLVLTYAYPASLLAPLLPPGLAVDNFGEFGFLAIALVQAEQLRPSFLPQAFGRECFLCGYRVFARAGAALRGLRIIESYTDRRWMRTAGNLLTHYRYQLCTSALEETVSGLSWTIRTPLASADLDVVADFGPASLPYGSPFATEREARRFAGPLPYTFDYEPETGSLIRIEGVRREWHPQPVSVEVRRNTFLDREPFGRERPILANAFHVSNLPYQWLKGRRM